MRPENQSSVSEFLLLGLPIRPEQQGVFFALFLGVYLTTVLGNLLILLLIRLDPRLHTPMYFFLSHLALTDVSFSSVTLPKMLMNMQTRCQAITYAGCISQVYCFIFFGCLDSFLLAVMAYDRYVAVCHPLHYTAIMRDELCVILVAGCWLAACAQALLHTLLVDQLSFCGPNVIPHFFCDLVPLLKLACSSTHVNDMVLILVAGTLLIAPFVCILTSYFYIALAILGIDSPKGKQKAFSNCTSHLSVVSLFYTTAIGVYLCPPSSPSGGKDRVFSVMYMVVTPLLNPFIYSLRNRDIKGALGKILRRNMFNTLSWD
uniref:Olfactory receptor n=1 Tax=Bos mutus grunniens TaxID=30521 RepID=A0A8B9XN02_BOSMU